MFDCVVSICSTCVVVLMIFSEFAFISLFAHGFLNGTGLVENSLHIVTKKRKKKKKSLPTRRYYHVQSSCISYNSDLL